MAAARYRDRHSVSRKKSVYWARIRHLGSAMETRGVPPRSSEVQM
jgi:hypothetical protein